jgi:hypothetical protein
MSAANASAPSSPSLQEEMRAHEPSMEEILASIRRIIADDQATPPSRRDRETRLLRPDVELRAGETASAAQRAYPAPALEAAPSVEVEDSEPAPEPEEVAPPPAPVVEIRQLRLHRAAPPPLTTAEAPKAEEPMEDAPETPFEPAVKEEIVEEALVSADTASSVASHFQALTASMFLNDSGLLQKYAQDMMRPMLREWLDDNLPVIVERLVRAEIERVARGARR